MDFHKSVGTLTQYSGVSLVGGETFLVKFATVNPII